MNIMKWFTSIDIEEILRILQFGVPKQKGTIYDIRSVDMDNVPSPVFFLSTGRCGTAWFSNLISSDRSVKVLHNPTPTLTYQSKLAFEHYYENEPDQEVVKLFKEIYLAGRESHIRYSYKTKRRIVETNSGITFFCYILAELFPNAKFVHLIRNPLEFISSGLRRDYYIGSNEDIRRIKSDQIFETWNETDRILKVAWLWYSTNSFIYEFGKKYPDRIYRFNFSKDLNLDKTMNLLDFLEIKVSKRKIDKNISKPINVQKGGNYTEYENWSPKLKAQFHNLCDKLIEDLNMG